MSGLMVLGPLLSTCISAKCIDSLMALSSLERPLSSSFRRGSTLALIFISFPRAAAARVLTVRALSCRPFTNVLWSCGTKGFNTRPPFPIMMAKVCVMAALTCHGKRSPIIRMRGPVILTADGLSAPNDVASIISPSASAANSRCSDVPWSRPCSNKGNKGARALGWQRPRSSIASARAPPERRLARRLLSVREDIDSLMY
mmetsp:Transcript_12212/g.44556  ORF Transcript_12212/g.44556 Transcript_12212/m.44556 type:complete len:201 (-) Transcript_12212:1023-1625(-)